MPALKKSQSNTLDRTKTHPTHRAGPFRKKNKGNMPVNGDLSNESIQSEVEINDCTDSKDLRIKRSDYLVKVARNRKLPEGAIFLRGLRKREGLTQAEFSIKIGLSDKQKNNISLMENGHRAISLKMAKLIGKVFKTDYRFLV